MKIEIHNMEFSAAHFLIEHDKCSRMHGHNWRLSVVGEGEIDKNGFVMDFSEFKMVVRGVVVKYDRRILIPTENEQIKIKEIDSELELSVGDKSYVFPKRDCLLLPLSNVTCEELAVLFWNEIRNKLGRVFESMEVLIEEKKGQGARYKKMVRGI